jgi:hypothetical protein
MSENEKTPNALVPIDGFDDTADVGASPLRGTAIRFKDGLYFTYGDQPFDTKDRSFVVLDKADGWQKLAEGVPPEYVMREPGKLRPPRPHVDEKDWPLNLNKEKEHPWKLTRYLYLLDTKTGEVLTFWSNTTGGRLAFEALAEQVKYARMAQPEAVPVIALEDGMFTTGFGSAKAKPTFGILGYKMRSHAGPQNMLPDDTKAPLVKIEKPTLAQEMRDEIPAHSAAKPAAEGKPWDDPPDLGEAATKAPETPTHKPAVQTTKRGVQKTAAGRGR